MAVFIYLMAVLIRTFESDLHACAIKWAIDIKDERCRIWDVTSFPAGQNLSSRVSNLKTINTNTLNDGDGPERFEDFATIWNRRGGQLTHVDGLSQGDRRYAEQESKYYLSSLYLLSANNSFWVNDPTAQIVSNQKLHQLYIASSVGLNIPETLASNTPAEVKAFLSQYGPKIVFKPFEVGMWGNPDGRRTRHISYATKIGVQDLDDDVSIQASPGIYQKAIDKKFDIRVLIAGHSYLAVKISIPDSPSKEIDWRGDSCAIIEPCRIDEIVFSRLKNLMSRLGIVTGSVDLVEDHAGQVHFIEVNESGQFLFMEESCEDVPVTDFFASFLISPKSDFIWNQSTQIDHRCSFSKFVSSSAYADYKTMLASKTKISGKPILED
ncbi:MAG: hypothetical protein ABJN69_05050 [Hellea sp.]